MSAPRPRRPSTTPAIRSDSFSAQLLRAAHDRLALGEARPAARRAAARRSRAAPRPASTTVPVERSSGDVELADRLVGRDPSPARPRARRRSIRAHALERCGRKPVRVQLRPTSSTTHPRAGHEDRRGGDGTPPRTGRRARTTSSSSSSSTLGTVTRTPSRCTRHAGAAQHPLGVVAARRAARRPWSRRRPAARDQHARLDLRARDRQLVVDRRAAARRATVNGGKRPVARLDAARPCARSGSAMRSTGRRRIEASPSSVQRAAVLPGEPARQQPHERAGVADVDRPSGVARPRAGPTPRIDAARRRLRSTQRAERPQRVERRVRVLGVEVVARRGPARRPSRRAARRGARSTCRAAA